MNDKQFKALFHFKRARHVCLATGHGTKTLIYQIAVLVALT